MSESERTRTDETEQIERLLEALFARAEAYRYDSASIRVRSVDERFRGKPIPEREAMVEPHLEELPKDTQADITMLLLIPPEEAEESVLNVEFEHPSPSVL